MPKGFTDAEKERIRAQLLEKGKEFLKIYGIRKTNVEDFTRAVGISKGSFYLFFHSKEELFFEILENLDNEVQATFFQAFSASNFTKEAFKKMIHGMLDVFDTHPLLNNFNKEEFQYLLRKLPEEKVQQHFSRDDELFITFIAAQQKAGHFKECNPKAVAGLFKSLFYTHIHREEFDPESYPETIKLFIELIADYLVKERSIE